MTLLYSDPRFLDHDTGRGHPERAERLRQIVALLDSSGLAAQCARPQWQPATLEQIERVHRASHVKSVADLAARGGGRPDPDTVVCSASFDVARFAAGAAADAVGRVLAGEDRTALCLVRPPGHHALPDRAMGFCLFNNVAVAARVAIDEHGLDRVLIVDWDVHHGNGTQDIFYADGRVGFLSIHRWPFYPGTGATDETGAARGSVLRATCRSNSALPATPTAKSFAKSWRRLPVESNRNWYSSAPASTATAKTRLDRSGWRSRISPS